MLKDINIMLTAAGSPGASTCIRFLKNIKERNVTITAVDASEESIGAFFADRFFVVPPSGHEDYVSSLKEIAVREKVDCLVVASSAEVEFVAPHIPEFEKEGIKVLVSSPDSLEVANNKRKLYEMFRDDPLVKVPEFKVVNSLDEFVAGCRDMGYPERKLCFKPPVSKGSRGFRFLSKDITRADLLMNHKPDNKVISLEEMIEIYRNEKEFPELLLMETVDGEEIDTMVIAWEGEALLVTHKTRETERGGVITKGGHVERDELVSAVQEIIKKIPLSYNVGIQFKGGYLIEINPRLSTFLYTDDWVEPYFAVKLALGEFSKDDVKALQGKVPLNLRMIRYFDQYFFGKS